MPPKLGSNDSKFTVDGALKYSEYKYFSVEEESLGGEYAVDWRLSLYVKKLGQRHNSLFAVESRLFNCCGTSGCEGMSFIPGSEEAAQEWMTMLLYGMQYYRNQVTPNFYQTPDVLFCVPGCSLKYPENKALYKLLKLGAIQIASFPNLCHGPEELFLYRWHPLQCKEQLLKEYIYFNTQYSCIPLYAKEMWENEQRSTATIVPTPVAKQPTKAINGGFIGQENVGPVGNVLGDGIQQPIGFKNLPKQVDWANDFNQLFGNGPVK